MSDFFGGLTSGNMRFTDARINGDGPLPTSLSGPEGINGDADGRYNFNDSLLSGITPYALAGQGRMGSDRNYQQIPHRKQFVVPPIFLPDSDVKTEQTVEMSHGVDMGDIAFILNVKHKRFLLCPPPYGYTAQDEDHSMPNYNVFVNICTVNYLLAGMHNYIVTMAFEGREKVNKDHAWGRLLICFGVETQVNWLLHRFEEEYTKVVKIKQATETPKDLELHSRICFTFMNLRCQFILKQIVKTNIIPLGICSMSEKQGGQHEVGLKPVQAAASFYTTLTVDGQNRDLVNIWRSCDINGGDFLILRLDFMPNVDTSSCTTKRLYILNHYYKDTVTKTLSMHPFTKGTWQLIPDTFSFSQKRKHDVYAENLQEVFSKVPEKERDVIIHHVLDYRIQGYWHIGQVYTKKQSFSEVSAPCNDMEMMQGSLLQINFAPVWKGDPMFRKHSDGDYEGFFILSKFMELAFNRNEPLFVEDSDTLDTLTEGLIRPPREPGDELQDGYVSGVIGNRRQGTQLGAPSEIVLNVNTAHQGAELREVAVEPKHKKSKPASQGVQAQPPAPKAPGTDKRSVSDEPLPSKKASDTSAEYDFEKELEKMYADHEAKSKPEVSKTKTGKVASNLAQDAVPKEGAGVKS